MLVPVKTLVVVSHPDDWPQQLRGVDVVSESEYLTGESYSRLRGARVYNLCRSYRYQSAGYYVSLLAAARGHRPSPSLLTLLDMRNAAVVRTIGGDLDESIQSSLKSVQGDRFELSVYFGRNMAKRHERLCTRLREQFPAPLFRARFERQDRWVLTSIAPIPAKEVPASHWPFLLGAAEAYFARPASNERRIRRLRYRMAILHDPDEGLAPSDPKALKRFVDAAARRGIAADMIQRSDYSRLSEYDALFLRETTRVNHHTFRFAQRAQAEGIVVIDDPQSIIRCSNKVYFAEAMKRAGVQVPATWIGNELDLDRIEGEIGFPCVVKNPDGAFSKGVHRCPDEQALRAAAAEILSESDLLVVQAFVPSEYDWRVGVLEGQPLYACRYHMARGHWQIAKHAPGGRVRFGKVESVPLAEAPDRVVSTAVKAARAMGDGLYGVDLKQFGRTVLVIEVNDNPNLEAGLEDAELGRELYDRIVDTFWRRLEQLYE